MICSKCGLKLDAISRLKAGRLYHHPGCPPTIVHYPKPLDIKKDTEFSEVGDEV